MAECVIVSLERAVDETSHTPLQGGIILLWGDTSLISKRPIYFILIAHQNVNASLREEIHSKDQAQVSH